jgi:NAD(P)-dependent dehydrogenase (short-subunit alcohol dehydrogenase family)
MVSSMWRQRSGQQPALDASAEGRRFVVTGGNGGVGFATAQGLLQAGGEVVLACRNPERVAGAVARLEPFGAVSSVGCDLGDLDAAVACADELADRFGRIDVLVANAGIWPRRYAETAQGHEMAFGTNVLGHHALICRLVANGGLGEGSRVVLVTGDIYVLVSTCTADFAWQGVVGGQLAYCRSKLGNLWQRAVYARRHPGIDWFAVHPGVINSDLTGAHTGLTRWALSKMMVTLEEGARTSIRASLTDEAPGYLHNVLGRMSLDADDPAMDLDAAEALLATCDALVAPHLTA